MTTQNVAPIPVSFQRIWLVRCACGSYRSDTIDQHAPRWVNKKLVDCQGREVKP